MDPEDADLDDELTEDDDLEMDDELEDDDVQEELDLDDEDGDGLIDKSENLLDDHDDYRHS